MNSPLPSSTRGSSHPLVGDWNLAEAGQDFPLADSLLTPPPDSPRQGTDRSDAADGTGSQPQIPPISSLDPRIEGHDADPGPDSLLAPGGPHSVEAHPTSPAIRTAGLTSPAVSNPAVGETYHGFLILAELGRGAFARVYLAEQVELGRRLVALKVGRAEGDEPQMLARLQHTHIMPIHSVYDVPGGSMRLMCMPYLGGANLAQVLDAALSRHSTRSHGKSLVDALDDVTHRQESRSLMVSAARSRLGSRSPSRPGPRELSRLSRDSSSVGFDGRAASPATLLDLRYVSVSRLRSAWDLIVGQRRSASPDPPSPEESDFDQPSRHFLRAANAEQASAWVIARLAEGLEHAHSRGILHRDLKPSNILIAGDGTPMLLDFNLSSDTRATDPNGGEKALLGGTLPYMAPEHLDAFSPRGASRADAVDERSDIYALGLILFEMIAGQPAFEEPPPGRPLLDVIDDMAAQRRTCPSLKAVHKQASWSLESVVKTCLAPDPARRYARARDLAEDLSRHLDDLPLKHAPEPSLRERVAKWARRNPRFCSAGSIGTAALLVILAFGCLVGVLSSRTQDLTARVKLQLFRTEFAECQFLLNVASGPSDHLRRGLELADKTLAGQRITPSGGWGRDSWVHRLAPEERAETGARTVELILHAARARTYLAGRAGTEDNRRGALTWSVAWLDRAETLDPKPPATLYAERARYLSALGEAEWAARDRRLAATLAPTTSRHFALLGSSLLARGDLVGAQAALLRAVALDSRAFWAWFALGHCHFEQGRYADAAGDFNACVALEPKFSWPHLNRGLALARAGRLAEARDAYHRSVSSSPRFAEAWLNLALVDLELNDLEAAEDAIERAHSLGLVDSGVLVVRAEIKARLGRRDEADRLFLEALRKRPENPVILTARGFFRMANDRAGATADLEHALAVDPRHARASYGLAVLNRKDAPADALRHVEAALLADPNLLDALQLRALLRARLGNLAALDDAERLILVPTVHRLYNASCALALLVEHAHETRLAGRAIDLLDRAFAAGFSPETATKDPDLASLRAFPGYHEVLRKANASRH